MSYLDALNWLDYLTIGYLIALVIALVFNYAVCSINTSRDRRKVKRPVINHDYKRVRR